MLVTAFSLIVTYDVERLYPSIPHAAALLCLRAFLTRHRCPFVDFAVTALDIILSCNYCVFGGTVYKQFLGFATGVACASE